MFNTGTAGPIDAKEPPESQLLNVAYNPEDSVLVRGEDMALMACGFVGASGRVYVEYDRAIASEKSVAPLYCQIGSFTLDEGQLVIQSME